MSEFAPDAPFSEPWHAYLFALTVALNEAGHFTWSEWADVFGPRRSRSDATDDGSDYFHDWADALVALLDAKGVADVSAVAAMTRKWQEAAHATPHGEPISLDVLRD